MIPYGRQSINSDDIDAVVAALKGDFLTTGPLVEIFEDELEKVTGAPTITVSSGTAALHCAYAAIDLQPGDEVITPPITFVATQATAAMFGAKIVFVDIQADTGNIDPNLVEAAITSRTKAIVAVDYAGHPADLDELRSIADKFGIYLIEDAAHSIGSTYRGRKVGSIADITTFSFFPTKNVTTGEGGAVSSIHPNLLQKAKRFARQGLVRDRAELLDKSEGIWHQEVHKFGLNYRMPDILCALGISQIRRIQQFKLQRSQIFETYKTLFANYSEVKFPVPRNYVSPMWHLMHIHLDANKRMPIFDILRENRIRVQVNYLPAYRHPVFQELGYSTLNLPVSESFYSGEISLPIYVDLTKEEINRIFQVFIGALKDL